MAAAIPASSSSIWMKCPPIFGSSSAITSAISVEGVMGYPPKKLQPAAKAPWASAVFPCQKATSAICLILLHRDSEIGTNALALTTADALLLLRRLRLQAIAEA